jgi:hypothetical protein
VNRFPTTSPKFWKRSSSRARHVSGVKPNAAEIVERVNTLTYYQLRLREPVDFFDPRVDVKVLDRWPGTDPSIAKWWP